MRECQASVSMCLPLNESGRFCRLRQKGKNAVQARKNLTDVYEESVLTVRQCQNWFAKFRSGNFDVEMHHVREVHLKLIKTR
ncbi:hypothetical protein TNCV_3739311 [Trichonephila clavipes]|nr:hypothetical protein TNCV_3739311 [Trichonephila clavipes]